MFFPVSVVKWSSMVLFMSGMSWLCGQDLRVELKVGDSLLVNPRQLPEVKKAAGLPQEVPAQVVEQDSATLETKKQVDKPEETIPELDALREKSAYHTVVNSEGLPVNAVRGERLDNDLQEVSAVYRKTGEQGTNCLQIASSVRQRVKRDPDSILLVMDQELRANPGCSCEIVKAAVLETNMEVETVVELVKVAIEASPQNMRLISQCAIAACPEALSAIQELLAKYDKNSPEGDSAKSAKGEKATIFSEDEVAAAPNPLDFPGGPDGYNITFHPPPILIITPQNTTTVDP